MLMDLKLLGHQVCMSTHYDSVYWTVKDIWNECLYMFLDICMMLMAYKACNPLSN